MQLKARMIVITTSVVSVMVGATARAENDAVAPAGNSLKVVAISPAPGEVVSKSTTIKIDVEYNVRDFENDKFRIAGLLANRSGQAIFQGHGDRISNHVTLEKAHGRVHIELPLDAVWDLPDLSKRPLRVLIKLTKITERDPEKHTWKGTGIAAADPIEYDTK